MDHADRIRDALRRIDEICRDNSAECLLHEDLFCSDGCPIKFDEGNDCLFISIRRQIRAALPEAYR